MSQMPSKDEILKWISDNPTLTSKRDIAKAFGIKGAARIIDLDVAVGLAHAMEDCFVAVQDGKETLVSARVDQLLEGTDFLRSLAGLEEPAVESWSEENRPGIDALVERLRAEAPAEAGPAAGTGSEATPAAAPTCARARAAV